ncbi:MAG: NAD(+)/NADH kinase, partial [Chloroflexota bacterium]
MSLWRDADAPDALVGIIANPASGKDIRRLVAHATTVDNVGKVGIIRRALIGLGVSGILRAAYMPDRYHLVEQALRGLEHSDAELPRVAPLPLATTDVAEDSSRAAALLCEQGAGCILVLGGDGTVRAVSRGAGDVPLLPISTGTNNVLPAFVESTVAGIAAGALARGLVPLGLSALRHKWIEIRVNGTPRDRALVDVAVLRGRWTGARAVWQASDLLAIAVTRADPAAIGISAIAGALQPLGP